MIPKAAPRLPKLTLKKDLRRALHGGAPWIYRDAVAAHKKLADGTVVLVLGKDGRPIARGIYSASGPIAVRVLTTDPREAVDGLVGVRLERALKAREGLLVARETTAFRWVHGEGDKLPGLHVDVYGAYASVYFDGAGPRAFYERNAIAPLLLEKGKALGLVAVVERGPRGESGSNVTLAGEAQAGEIEIREDGIVFGVDLAHGQKGGLFLDQRDNRALIRGIAQGRRVLNLFGYTGGFSLHAAFSGARQTTTVDSAAPAIEAAKRNFERNAGALAALGPREGDDFVVADAFEYLEQARARGKRWDLVISDPPSFAPNERAKPAALQAYTRLHRLCASVVEPSGILCAASCSSHVSETEFVRTVTLGAAEAGRRFEFREALGAASDHPVLPAFPEGRYLKFIVGSVR
ncbi:MAG TPA: class I SAM-dependent rRNA methyltransferase [Polyangiaceae bacterium]